MKTQQSLLVSGFRLKQRKLLILMFFSKMKGGLSFSVGDDIEVKSMASTKNHHHAASNGELEDVLFNSVLDIRRCGSLLLENSLVRLLKGRSFALVGNNGVGKTTLLRVLASFEEDTHLVGQFGDGEMRKECTALQHVMLNDARLNRVREKLEVCDGNEVEMLASEEDLLSESAEERARDALRRVGFRVRALREATPVGALSGGWRMRVRLATALNSGAKVLLLDEPTTSLDLQGIDMLIVR
jgi:elongation factor 3